MELLVEKVGGPSVKPYQPAGCGKSWREAKGTSGIKARDSTGAVFTLTGLLLETYGGASLHGEFRFTQSRNVYGA